MKKAKAEPFFMVVTFRGSLAFSDFEERLVKILGRNESGSGTCLLSGNRELTAFFETAKGLENVKTRLKGAAKERRVKLNFIVYQGDTKLKS